MPLKIFFATSELAPLAKTGGLADVSYALTAFFQATGHDVRVLMPLYESIDRTKLDLQPVAGQAQGLDDLQLKIGEETYTYAIRAAQLPDGGPEVCLLDCPRVFRGEQLYGGEDEHVRFLLLSLASIEMCRAMGFAPDIFHCNDWHTALVPLYLKTRYASDPLFAATRSVLTIHNIGYQGVFGSDVITLAGLEAYADWFDGLDREQGRVNFLKNGVMHADLLTTVSPTYAREILSPEYGMGLEWHLNYRRGALKGILNGVDYREWNPEDDSLIPHRYSSRRMQGKEDNKRALAEEMGIDYRFEVPMAGIISRLTHQKGLELVQAVVPDLMREREFTLAVLGSGDEQYVQFFHWLRNEFPGRVGFHDGYSNQLAHRIEAGADLFLMPSRYEPCGLNQMYSLRYGTVPVVRATGGLADSVQHFDPATGEGTGVVFHDFDANGLRWAMETAFRFYTRKRDWRTVVANGMSMDFSWQRQGQVYIDEFRKLIAYADKPARRPRSSP
jgi:starch synthase